LKAVNDVSFQIEDATCFCLLGPNGAGKTTLMKMIYGRALRDVSPKSKIRVYGYDPQTEALMIKHLSGIVPQENNLDEELNVSENLKIYSKFYGIPSAEAEKTISFLLEFMELSDKKNARIRELSGGMKRRIVIARALLNNPKLLILDEPTTGLDPQVRHMIWDKLKHLKKEKTTILLTTHYMDEAFQIADNIVIMEKGKKAMEGAPHRLMTQNIEKYVMEIKTGIFEHISGKMSENTGQAIRKEISGETVFIYSNDLKILSCYSDTAGETHCYIRQTNLEDLFLKITGRKLNEQQ